MALLKNRLLFAKIETTEGSDASPSATTDACQVIDLEVGVDADDVEREISTPYLGAKPVVLTKRQTTFKFDVEIAGSGTAGTAPAWGPYVQGCGFAEVISGGTVVYSPISTGFPSLTIYANMDGVLHKSTGCRGSFEIAFEVGEIPKFSFEMMGSYLSPIDQALPTPSFANQAIPVHFASGNANGTLDLFPFCFSEVNFDLSNEMSYRELVNCAKSNKITDRQVEGEILIERPDTLAIKNLYPKVEAHTLVPFTMTHGTTAGNKVKIDAPNLQLYFPEQDDDDGILMANYSVKAIPSSAGNDELTITVF